MVRVVRVGKRNLIVLMTAVWAIDAASRSSMIALMTRTREVDIAHYKTFD
jgi:hypothetical protein